MKKMILTIAACAAIAALSGCAGAKAVPDPVGIGTGVHELKKSPCACTNVPMHLPDGTPIAQEG